MHYDRWPETDINATEAFLKTAYDSFCLEVEKVAMEEDRWFGDSPVPRAEFEKIFMIEVRLHREKRRTDGVSATRTVLAKLIFRYRKAEVYTKDHGFEDLGWRGIQRLAYSTSPGIFWTIALRMAHLEER